MSGLNWGDILFQLLNIAFLVLIVVLIVSFLRSNKRRRNQLDRLEQKMDEIQEQLNKGKD